MTPAPSISVAAYAITALALASCSADPKTFVGAADGDALLAIEAPGDGSLVGYLCDGHAGAVTRSEWMEGTLEGDRVTLGGTDLQFDGMVEGTELRGAFAGQEELILAAVEEPAGLYRMEEDGGVNGWIVNADGTQRGAISGQVAAGQLYTTSATSLANVTGNRVVLRDSFAIATSGDIASVRVRFVFPDATTAQRFEAGTASVKVTFGDKVVTANLLPDQSGVDGNVRVYRISSAALDGVLIDIIETGVLIDIIETGFTSRSWQLGGGDWELVSRPGTADEMRIEKLRFIIGLAG